MCSRSLACASLCSTLLLPSCTLVPHSFLAYWTALPAVAACCWQASTRYLLSLFSSLLGVSWFSRLNEEKGTLSSPQTNLPHELGHGSLLRRLLASSLTPSLLTSLVTGRLLLLLQPACGAANDCSCSPARPMTMSHAACRSCSFDRERERENQSVDHLHGPGRHFLETVSSNRRSCDSAFSLSFFPFPLI